MPDKDGGSLTQNRIGTRIRNDRPEALIFLVSKPHGSRLGLAGCFPPHQTVYRWFTRFRDDGTWESLNHHLVMLDRVRASREANPTQLPV